jgi:hypothetical protein
VIEERQKGKAPKGKSESLGALISDLSGKSIS